MTSRVNRETYQRLIDEDISWLETVPRTLERDHVVLVLRQSVEHEYPTTAPAPAPSRSADDIANALVHVAADADQQAWVELAEMRDPGFTRRWTTYAPSSPAWSRVAHLRVAGGIERSRTDGAAAAHQAAQPRDLAGRIRALIQEYAGRWADSARLPESRLLRVEACMHAMRWLWHALRRLESDGASPEDRITELREYTGDDIVATTMRELADELEAVVRDAGEQR